MGRMSDLHLLATRVIDGESVDSVVADTTYAREEIEWAVEQLQAESTELSR